MPKKIRKLKPLYKKTATGKIQLWRIWVDGNTIHSESGQVDGKKIQSKDIIKKGKNEGRANATTPEEQALKEAKAKWQKKLKSGYVKDIKDAEAGKTDSVIKGGYIPMTAKKFFDTTGERAEEYVLSKDSKHIKFPCAIQPKLDGERCCVYNSQLFTRTRKRIKTVPHIEKAVNKITGGLIRLDGELYNHEYKEEFEKIMSMVKREKELHKDFDRIQYHIYDINIQGTFKERWETLTAMRKKIEASGCLKLVETVIVDNYDELIGVYEEFLDQGYEGGIVRNLNGPYESKRSKHVQKLKQFHDAEFKILNIAEGRGKYAGNIGAFICQIDDEHGVRTFRAKPKGKIEHWRKIYQSGEWKGKWLTVRYQRWSNKDKKPTIVWGLRLRDEEEVMAMQAQETE